MLILSLLGQETVEIMTDSVWNRFAFKNKSKARKILSSHFFLIGLLAISPFLSVASPAFQLGPKLSFGNNYSLNWSGYAVTGSSDSVSYVAGSWTVPSISCTRQTAYAAFWAGIDGFNSKTVEQAGILGQCSSGSPVYSAWYEFYPAGSVTINSITVKPGDVVEVTVSYNSSGEFTVSLTDGSQPTFTVSSSVTGAARSSAECITERPSIAGSLTKLADFGTVKFGQDYTTVASTCYATINGLSASFGSFSTVQEITMVSQSGRILAQPSPLSSDGSSFTVAWKSSN
jgi:hypothetical protein